MGRLEGKGQEKLNGLKDPLTKIFGGLPSNRELKKAPK